MAPSTRKGRGSLAEEVLGLFMGLGVLAGLWWGRTNKTHTPCSHRGGAAPALNRCVSTSINGQVGHWAIGLIGGALLASC